LPSGGTRITLLALLMSLCRTVTRTRSTRTACAREIWRRRTGALASAGLLLFALGALDSRVASARPPRPAAPSDADEKKETPWGASLAASLSASSGKDDVFTSSVDAKVAYDARPHVVRLDINSFFSIKNAKTDADRAYVGLEYRYFWTEPTFGYGQASAEQNQQQNLDFRTTWAGGLGRTFVLHQDPNFFLQSGRFTVQGGSGYQYQDLKDPAATLITHRWIVQAGSSYDATFKRNVRWNNRVLFVVPPLDVEEWRTIYTSDLKLPLIGNLTFLTNLTLDYLNGPILEVRQSQKLTFFVSIGLSYAFGSEVDR
jgi:putative salt-induced outer membrane protein YdiY